jgi:2-phospho-L-lactate/phosphoenolpyruvate guanylyltransferase
VRTLAVLPVKSFGLAKQRLGVAVGADERRALARAMVGDVLEALGRVARLEGVIVVTAEAAAVDAARGAGIADGRATATAARRAPLVEVVPDASEAGQSAAASLGIRAAVTRGAERVLLVPGDCPALAPAEVEALLDAAAGDGPRVTVVPDRHGTGTNALVLAPPDAIACAFGPGSRARHVALARAAGARVEVAAIPSLGLDVDTPGDLTALRAALAARPGGAARTRAVLERLLPVPPAPVASG